MDGALEALSASYGEGFDSACADLQEVFVRDQPIVGLVFLDESLIMARNIAGGTSAQFHSPFGNIGKWFYVKE